MNGERSFHLDFKMFLSPTAGGIDFQSGGQGQGQGGQGQSQGTEKKKATVQFPTEPKRIEGANKGPDGKNKNHKQRPPGQQSLPW